MSAKYSDQDIANMLSERKPLPANYQSRIQLRPKRGHKEAELTIEGEQGREYHLILRQSDFNRLDFSIILSVMPEDSNQRFRLHRYNGKSHTHSNQIEKDSYYDFHIHTATERYQRLGSREDTFAEPTDRYADFHTAISCMLDDCGFIVPDEDQGSLFGDFR